MFLQLPLFQRFIFVVRNQFFAITVMPWHYRAHIM